jgi:hypothetical protein
MFLARRMDRTFQSRRYAGRQAPGRRTAHAGDYANAARFGGHRQSLAAYAHDWADLLAQQEADAEQKQRDQREANRTRLRPSSVEIARRRCETNAPGCI